MSKDVGTFSWGRRGIFALVLTVAFSGSSALGQPGYSVITKIPIPGQGSWDYLTVDEMGRRLYVSHGTQVEVLDVDAGNVVGQIRNTPGEGGQFCCPGCG